jgi:competence ComEA-like helix-hairpin-helix protein
MYEKLSLKRALFPALLLSIFLCFSPACVNLSQHVINRGSLNGQKATPVAYRRPPGSPLINLNTASAVELEKLPGIGPTLAARIVAHRERYGRFRRAEHLILVRGMSDGRFRRLRDFVTV